MTATNVRKSKVSEKSKVGFNVIDAIAKVSEELKDSKLKCKETKEFSANVKNLNGYFGTSGRETWMLCAMISHYFDNEGDSSNFNDMARFFDCPVMSVITFKDDVESLLARNFVKNKADIDVAKVGLKNEFELSRDVLNCILQNVPIEIPEDAKKEKTPLEFVKKLDSFVNGRYVDEELSCFQMRKLALQLEKEFSSLQFVKETASLILDEEYRIFFYSMCFDFYKGTDTHLNTKILNVFEESQHYEIADTFMNENNILFERDLVEFLKKESLDNAEIAISYRAKELLLGENAKWYLKTAKGENIIEPNEIASKELFYSAEIAKQIDRLKSSLVEENLRSIQTRLGEKNLPKGIAVLLYGEPGTGKTESVYQIAKATGRKIFHVDISSSKSSWFGKSEKIVKKIFTDYKDLCKICKDEKDGKLPILLFNEADGILSKRKDATRGNVAQTENAMQNIILEEMEKLDGIMIATTNLAENLDSAFERRFLFKIKFENPSVEVKEKIWKSKLGWLNDADIATVAQNYDLSGGQIDNIVRKVTMDEVLTGEKPNFSELEDLCKSERIGSAKKKIGF